MRTFFAFLVAPLLVSLLPYAFNFWNGSGNSPFAVFVLFSGGLYALEVVVGIPVYLILSRTKMHHAWIYALVGFLGVAVPSFVFGMYRNPQNYGVDVGLIVSSQVGLFGAMTALLFWFIARPRSN